MERHPRPFDDDEVEQDDDPIDDDYEQDEETPLVPCPECGQMVYDDAEQCPYCGQYIVTRMSTNALSGRSWWYIALVLLGTAGFVIASLVR